MNLRLELLNNKLDSKVLVAVEYLFRIYTVYLKTPLSNLNDLVSQITKFNMTVIFSQVIYAFLRENGFHEIMAIRD